MTKCIKRLRLAALLIVGFSVGGCGDGTAAPALGEVVTIVPTGATHPSTAIDPRDGRAFVAWVGREGDEYGVYLASATAASERFGEPVRVNDRGGDAAPHEQAPAQVAVGPEGEVYLLWQNNTPIEGRPFPASDLRFAASTDGGRTFSAAISVNDDASETPSSHTFHDMIVGPDGTIVVSWIDSRDQEGPHAMGEHDHGGTIEGADTTSDIRVARSTDGGRTFSASIIVDDNPCPCCRTALAIGPDGGVYVAWRKIYPGNVRDVVVARADLADLDFAEPVRVGNDGWVYAGCPHAGPTLAIAADGRLHVGWYTGQTERQGLWYSSSDDGGKTFAAPTAIHTAEWVPPALVSLAPLDDEVMIAWDDRTADVPVIHFARVLDGAPYASGSGTATGRAPAFDASRRHAFAAWADGEAIRGRWVIR